MPKTYRNHQRVDAPPEILLEILTDPAFEVASQRAVGVVESHVEERRRDDRVLVYEVIGKEYHRTLTGFDRDKLETTATVYEWDLRERRARWELSHSQNAQTRMWGTVSVHPDGDGSRYDYEMNCKVGIPLLGGQIEKYIVKEFEKIWPKYEELVEAFVREKTGR